MRHEIAGKTVWVTGASSGIGAAMARAFAREHCTLALTARKVGTLDRLREEIEREGGEALCMPMDVRDRDGMKRIADDLAARTGRIDILCNNAGLNIPKRGWAEIDWPSWDRVMEINIAGALNAIAAVLPHMRERRDGLILNTASWAGRFHSAGGGVPYGASKHALMSLNASLNSEENANGIRATALCPAEVATPLLERRPGFDAATSAEMIQPEDMAETALYVARMNPKIAVNEIVLSPTRRSRETKEPA